MAILRESTTSKSHSLLFEKYCFVLIPNLTNKIAIFRKNLYKQNGATLSYRLTDSMDNGKTCVAVIEDSGPKVDKFVFARAFAELKGYDMSKNSQIVSKIPILKKEWAIESLQKQKIQPIGEKYEYPIEDVSVDSSIQRTVKVSEMETTEKKRHAESDTNTMTQSSKRHKLEGDSSSDNNDLLLSEYDTLSSASENEEDIEHRNSKQISSKRQLALLNSEREASTTNPNQLVIDYFTKMAQEYKRNGENFKYVNYSKAINTISGLKHKVRSYDEAIELPNVGKRLAEKIEQINKTGQLSQLEMLQNDPKLQTLQLFTSIYGVGPIMAKQWYDQGLRTIDDVSKLPTLSDSQRFGIKYREDWSVKIPRDEVEKHVAFIQETLKTVNEKAEIMCTGSYRRGYQQCGDIDFLLFLKDCNDKGDLGALLYKLIKVLRDEKGYIQCSLLGLSDKMRKFFGGARLEGYDLCRRIDILAVPWQRKGATLIYFTGNDILNRSIRQLAFDKGMHLNEAGLFENYKQKNQRVIESFDERAIFDKLGVKYREPTDRNIGNFNDLTSYISH